MPATESGKSLVIFQPSGRRGYVRKGKTVKEASRDLGVDLEGVCGEKAICGKCRIRLEEGFFGKYGIQSTRDHLNPITDTEKKFFTRQQEKSGYRLACQALIQGDVLFFVPEESRMGKQVVRKAATERPIKLNPAVKKYYVELPPSQLYDPLGAWERLTAALESKYQLTKLTIDYQVLMTLQDVLREGEWKTTVSVWQNREVIKAEPGRVEKAYGLAVDVGTTTVAGYLCDLTDGKVVVTASMMNPQVVYGEDVMSRISYALTDETGLAQMNRAIIDGLNGIAEDVASQAGIKRQDIVDMTIVGNTCMHHIFLNINPRYIGLAPFAPALHHSIDVKARDWGTKILAEKKRGALGGSPPCQVGCPAGVNAQDFIYLTAQGKYKEALDIVRMAQPFAGICGRVCVHPCEQECERGKVDEAMSIRSLHRFLADYESEHGRDHVAPVERTKSDRVAIVGSGPAGLACAYDLVRRGYPVTVFEAAPKAGGLLRYGIPEYRLPDRIVDSEIGYIEDLGVEIKTHSPIKTPQDLLSQGYKAVFVSTGAGSSRTLGVPGEEAHGVIPALQFLTKVNTGEKIKLGETVAVIGGGSVAFDAARSAVRLGAKKVHLVCLECDDLASKDRMLAQDTEIKEAQEEGVIFHPSLGVKRFLTQNGNITGIEPMPCTSVYEADGRFNPQYLDRPVPAVPADTAIVAIGQKPQSNGFKDLQQNPGGTLHVDPVTLATNIKGIFAGGDAVSGPLNVISAVASGKRAATSIELYLEGVDLVQARPAPLTKVENIPTDGVPKESRKQVAILNPEARHGMAEVELGFEEAIAQEECRRCLNCGQYAATEESEVQETRDIGIKISPGAYVHVLPIEAGFVGADNVGVLIAEEPYNQDSMELVIDIGTNGELIMGNRNRLISCSCATGPAFEGAEMRHGMRAAPGAIEKIVIDRETKEVKFKVIGKEGWNTETPDMGAKGICGSGIIDVVPQLLLAGIIDHTGKFVKGLKTPRARVAEGGPEFVIAWARETSIGQDIVICQDDVRNIQLAKAAMYAGARIMMRHLGIEKLDKVILAGAFGSYIDKVSAACLGLFPSAPLENIYAVGNAAGDGARIALLNVDKRAEADIVARQVKYVELTVEPDFQKLFAQAMWLPHMKDQFPHLESTLKPQAPGGNGKGNNP